LLADFGGAVAGTTEVEPVVGLVGDFGAGAVELRGCSAVAFAPFDGGSGRLEGAGLVAWAS